MGADRWVGLCVYNTKKPTESDQQMGSCNVMALDNWNNVRVTVCMLCFRLILIHDSRKYLTQYQNLKKKNCFPYILSTEKAIYCHWHCCCCWEYVFGIVFSTDTEYHNWRQLVFETVRSLNIKRTWENIFCFTDVTLRHITVWGVMNVNCIWTVYVKCMVNLINSLVWNL